MVRTAGTAIKTLTGGKSTKVRGVASTSGGSSISTSRRTIGKGVHQPTPKWQKPINNIFVRTEIKKQIPQHSTGNSLVSEQQNDEETSEIKMGSVANTSVVQQVNDIDNHVQSDESAKSKDESEATENHLDKENNVNIINEHSSIEAAASSSATSSSSQKQNEITNQAKRKIKTPVAYNPKRKFRNINFAGLQQFEMVDE